MSTQPTSAAAVLGIADGQAVRSGEAETGSLAGGGEVQDRKGRGSELEGESAVEKLNKTAKPIKDKGAKGVAQPVSERGPDGRFLPSGNPDGAADPLFEAKPQAEDAAVEETPEPSEEAQPEEGGEPFVFGGVEFKSQAAAEQAFKTQRGMHKAMMQREQAAVKNSEGWQQSYQQLKAEFDKAVAYIEQGAPPREARDASGEDALSGDVFVESLGKQGWQTFDTLQKEKGNAFAFAWLTDQLQRFSERRTKEMLDSALGELRDKYDGDLEPVRETQAQRKALGNVVEFFDHQASMVGDDGQYLYPELRAIDGEDEATARKRLSGVIQGVMEYWKDLVNDAPQSWHNPAFVRAAIKAYRADLREQAAGRGEAPETDALLDNVRLGRNAAGASAITGGAPVRTASRSARSAHDAFIGELVSAGAKSAYGNFKP